MCSKDTNFLGEIELSGVDNGFNNSAAMVLPKMRRSLNKNLRNVDFESQ